MAAIEPPEFQAVIMAAGKGSRMMDLTATRPKCLLPIGCKPMVWYPLQMLERNGFQDVILIVQEPAKAEIQLALERLGLKIHIDFVGIPANEDWGTADSLRFVGKKITTNVVILSCDLLTDFALRGVLDVFRVQQASLATVFFRPNEFTDTVPGPKTKNRPERDVIGWEPDTGRLVYCRSASDLHETLPIRKRLLEKHLRVAFHSSLVDSHLYVLRRWVVEYLALQPSLSTLKGEVLPHVVKHQLGRPKPRSKLKDNREDDDSEDDQNASDEEEGLTERGKVNRENETIDSEKDIVDFALEHPLELKIRNLSLYTDHRHDLRPPLLDDPYRCYAVVAPVGTIGLRVNAMPSYCQANHQVFDWWDRITGGLTPPPTTHPDARVQSTQVCARSYVLEHATLAERTSVSNTTVGPRCDVRQKVRLQRCVLIGSATVHEGCILVNCVLCDGAIVEANSKLTDCIVGANFVVSTGAKHQNETLTELEDLMEI